MTLNKHIIVQQGLLFSAYIILINFFLLSVAIIKDYAGREIISNWKIAQYFFTYSNGFVKRGFTGTVFDFTGIPVNTLSILIFSIVVTNLFFILFYVFAIKSFKIESNRFFIFFMVLFAISPAVAMHLGFDLGRFDHINLALTLIAIILIHKNSTSINIVLVLLIITIGLLTHEAFIFVNAPLILAITYNEVNKNNQPPILLYAEVFIMMFVMTALSLYGKPELVVLSNIHDSVISLIPDFDTEASLHVWKSSLGENIKLTILHYNISILLEIMIVLPLLSSYIYLSARFLNFSNMNHVKKAIFISPFGILPLFLLGVDFFRWFSLMIILIFISFVYLHEERRLTLRSFLITRKEKFVISLIIFYTLIGPLGIKTSFHFFITGINKILFHSS